LLQSLVLAAGGLDFAFWLVTDAAEVVALGEGKDFLHGHLVLGEGAGLIGANHGGGAKRFHSGQFANDGIALDHA